MTPSNPPVPRLAFNRVESAESMGVSPRTVDALIADLTSGFPVVRIGSRVVIPIRELADWLAIQAKGVAP